MRGVALVTGAGSGLGRRMAHRLSERGLAVGLMGRRIPPLEETAAGCADALVLPGDVREPDHVRAAVDTLVARHGRLDLVVAAAALLAEVDDPGVDPWTRFSCVLRTNVLGAALVAEEAARVMKPGGLVVLVGSSVAALPTPDHLAYGASKAAVEHLVGSLAVRYAARRLRVVGVAPGALFRDDGDDVATSVCDTVVYLASSAGRQVNGSVIRVDGGEVALARGRRR